MENIGTFFKVVCSAVCGMCGLVFGEMNGMFVALICFIVLDYITGVIAGAVEGKLSSSVGFRGIAKKLAMILMVAVGNLIDVYILGEGTICKSAVMGFYSANEGISILENIRRIGVPYPKFIEKILDTVVEENNKEEK